MTLDSAAEDSPGHAKQFLDCKKIDRDEHTVIPTAGISVGKRQYVQYMSVNYWGPAGSWFTNHSGFAYSDNGDTWTKDPKAIWPNTKACDDNFQMNALVRTGGYVYLIGTPNGRFGNAHLARVPERQVLRKNAWRYWDGRTWSTRETSAVPIAVGPISEVSVQWNAYLGKWLMMYLDQPGHRSQLRGADRRHAVRAVAAGRTWWNRSNESRPQRSEQRLRPGLDRCPPTPAERCRPPHPAYTKVSLDFDSGRESLIQLYAGFFGHGQDVWLQADDFTLEELR